MSKAAIPKQKAPNAHLFKDGLYLRGDRIVIVSGGKIVVKIGDLS